ncbi:outer membrane beta-barrel protein [Helicobacter baculiformis]|uniref:Outer membrane beta-barrel protein n=1 Tax=Helicobacter baculiformis TaxID=427351 RepID=A0ABV7ZGB5_9HELI|nr:outer membrane beta-barrel protein [Helicobacter baculiformis]
MKSLIVAGMVATNPSVTPHPSLQTSQPHTPQAISTIPSDPEIEQLKEQIRDLGGVPETQFYYAKKYIEKHYKNKSEAFKAKKLESYKIAKEKSGFFLGGGYGVGILEESYTGVQVIDTTLGIPVANDVFNTNVTIKGVANMLNLELGYQQFFNLYFGTRIYGDLLVVPGLATISTLNNKNSSKGFGKWVYGLGSLNMDALVDVPLDKQKQHFIGAYAGFGVGMMVLRGMSSSAFNEVIANAYKSSNVFWKMLMQADYTINIGLVFTYKRHLRFELGTKIPLTYLRLGMESAATYYNGQNSRTLIGNNIGFKRSSFAVLNVLYVF